LAKYSQDIKTVVRMTGSYSRLKLIRLLKTAAITVRRKFRDDVLRVILKEIVGRFYKKNKNRMMKGIKYLVV